MKKSKNLIIKKNDFTNLKIVLLTLAMRLFYTLLALISHIFLADFDKSSNYFLNKWDTFFFHHIIKNGYTAEHHLAFFPLLPILARFFCLIIPGNIGLYFFNLIINCINSCLLYNLSNHFVEKEISLYSLYFFIFNPVSIILSALYTESLFTLLFFLCLYCFIKKKSFTSFLIISLSCICRSNGILFVYLVLQNNFVIVLLSIVLISLPISIYQIYCISKIFNFQYKKILQIKNGKFDNIFKYKLRLRLFIPYSYIQKKYWNQGFFKFYTVNNIPNVLIGLPFVISNTVFICKGYKLECKNTFLFRKLLAILGMQTLLAIFFLHLNMYFRFVSYNPVIYIIMGYLYKYERNCILKLYLRFYLTFGVAYAILYGAFYPPA